MSWKQPIPTNLREVFGDDDVARHIFIEFLLRARNNDSENPERLGNKLHFLKKGQCVCSMLEFSRLFNRNRKTIKKFLENLQKVYNVVDIVYTGNGTVVTIKDFDSLIRMDNKMDNKVTTKAHQSNIKVDTNKSDKNDKKEEEYIPKNVSDEKLQDIATQFGISLSTVRRYYEKVLDYEKSSGKKYKDYAAATRNYIRNDIERGRLTPGEVIRL